MRPGSALDEGDEVFSELSVEEISDLLHVSPKLIYRLATKGSIPSFRVGGVVRFDPEAVSEWFESKTLPPDGRRLPSFEKAVSWRNPDVSRPA